MGKREILAGALLGALGLGGATMIEYAPALFPNHSELIFYLGVACVAIAFFGLLALFFWPEKLKSPKKNETTFAKLSEGSVLDVADSTSNAHTLLDAKDGSKATIRNVTHKPN